MLNIDADIDPGKSAAGFHLGQRYSRDLFEGGLAEWNPSSGLQIGQAIHATPGWLETRVDAGLPGRSMHYGRGMVDLRFNADGILFWIMVFNGYTGKVWGEIGIGSPIATVRQRFDVEYDDGDEMFYPVADSGVSGIAFIVDESLPAPEIVGISVQDWALARQA